jgi:ribonuclease HI
MRDWRGFSGNDEDAGMNPYMNNVLVYADASTVGVREGIPLSAYAAKVRFPDGVELEIKGMCPPGVAGCDAEAFAILKGIELAPGTRPITARSDCQGAISWLESGRRRKNPEMEAFARRVLNGRTVSFEWVKGHAGDPLNVWCDHTAKRLARKALESARKGGLDQGVSHAPSGGWVAKRGLAELAT